MNKTMYKKILLGGLSLLVLAGCQKGLFENKGGRAVSFTATSGVNTKAGYGDAVGTMQRIDWWADDEIKIFSDRAETPQGRKFALYKIDGNNIRTSGATSTAGLIRDEEAMLRYSETDKEPYTFVGVYPSSGAEIADGKVTVSSTIPSEQIIPAGGNGFPDMTKGTQLLSNAALVDWYQPVSLDFKPNFTSFEFTLAAEKTMSLVGFTVTSDSNVLAGEYTSEINLNDNEPAWSTNLPDGNSGNIRVSFDPLEMTLPEGETVTNSVKFGFYTFPKEEITGLTFTFFLKVDGVDVTRTLKVRYAKDGDGYRQGDPVKFEGGKKHNITGIVIPANLSQELSLDLAVIPWEDESGTITYGQDAVFTADAIDYISGAAVTDGSRREKNNFENATDPILAYFYVYSPIGATWKVNVTGATDKILVSSTTAGATSTPTDDGLTISGKIGGNPPEGGVHRGRVDLKFVNNGATASDSVNLTFSVVIGTGESAHEVSIDSEIIRCPSLQITGKVGQ